MAELLGKVSGCSRGKGGSMHFFDAEKGFLGGHAIVGSHIPLAAGVAFAMKYRGEDRVCACYFGDGAINQGSVHEALNMAALWKLPVIYIVENNLYAMGTSIERSTAVLDLRLRGATAYGIPGFTINGNDIELMAKTTREAANRARAGEGPTFIEAQTYRYKGHSISDPGKYRLRDELDSAMKNDPIVVYQNILKDADGSTTKRSTSCARTSEPRSKRRSSLPNRASRRRLTSFMKISPWPRLFPRSDHGLTVVSRSLEPGHDRGDGPRRPRLPDG